MNIPLIIDSLEEFYHKTLLPILNRYYNIETYFVALNKSIETQFEIISLKKQIQMDTEENEKERKRLQENWSGTANDLKIFFVNLGNNVDRTIHSYQSIIAECSNSAYNHEKLKMAKEKKKDAILYTIDDVEKITGKRPF